MLGAQRHGMGSHIPERNPRRAHWLLVVLCLTGAVAFWAEFLGLSALVTDSACEGNLTKNEGLVCGVRGILVSVFGPYGEKVFSGAGGLFMLYCAWHIFKMGTKDAQIYE
jgi:hypothetical protein